MASTFNISPTDFKVRMQKIACCLASKGYIIANKLKGGNKCEDDIKRQSVAHAMFDLIKCYSTTKVGLPTFTDCVYGSTIFSYIGYFSQILIEIGTESYTIDLSETHTLTEIITEIRNAISNDDFNIEYNSDTECMTYTFPCKYSELDLSMEWSVPEVVGLPKFTEILPICTFDGLDDSNCTTTDQINQRFEWFQEYCDICFDADYGGYEQINFM